MANHMSEMIFHLKFGKKDADLVYWKSSVPPSCFSQYVRQILLAEKKKTIAFVPVSKEKGFEYKTVDTKVYLYSRSEMQFINSIPNGKRCATIRAIIRKHLDANYLKNDLEDTPKQTLERDKPVPKKEGTAPAQIETKEDEFDDVSEEYRNLLKGLSD